MTKKEERTEQRFGEKSQKKRTLAMTFVVWILIIIITGKSDPYFIYACM